MHKMVDLLHHVARTFTAFTVISSLKGLDSAKSLLPDIKASHSELCRDLRSLSIQAKTGYWKIILC